MSVAEEREPEQIDAGARKSVFMRHFTYARALMLERLKFGETERECWDKAKKDHINTEAARLVLRLKSMDPLKAADFLRSFDAYRRWANVDAQIDLFPEPEDDTIRTPTIMPQAAAYSELEDAPLPESRRVREGDPRFAEMDIIEPDPDQPERYAELTDAPDISDYSASFRIGPETPDNPLVDGRQACRLGIKTTMNPYDPDDAPEAYEEWGDAWTGAYASGEWGVDLAAEDPAGET